MFQSFFDKRGAATKGKRIKRGDYVVPASEDTAARTDPASDLDMAVDDSLVALSRELSGLAHMEVPEAARARGWATLQRELDRRPVRVGAAAAKGGKGRGASGAERAYPSRSGHLRGFRWALASAAGVVAVATALLGTYGGGLLQTAYNGQQTSAVTSVAVSETSEPVTTVTTGSLTSATTEPVTTVTTDSPTSATTEPVTGPSTASTNQAAGGSIGTTRPSEPDPTRPSGTTTTAETQLAASQREGSAKAAAAYLANVVLTADTTGAGDLVAADAQSSLVQMMMSLNDPYGYTVTDIRTLTGATVRVTLNIQDRVSDSNGELVETVKSFFIRVLVDSEGAVITAINAGS